MPYNILGDLQTIELSASAVMDNDCCILTINDTVQIMDNVTLTDYTGGEPFATLPESMRPMATVMMPVVVYASLYASDKVFAISTMALELDVPQYNIMPLTVNESGELSLSEDIKSGTVYLNGLEFNVCNRYYNAVIGNNFSQGTSPLRWDGGVS